MRRKPRTAAFFLPPVWSEGGKDRNREKKWKWQFHPASCFFFFFMNSIELWRNCKGWILHKLCGNIYYWCSVCGCGPVAVALWGTAHLLVGFPAFVPGFFPVWIICLNYWGNDKTVLIYTSDPFACMPVSQKVLYKRLWCFKFDVICNCIVYSVLLIFFFFFFNRK